MAEKSKIRDRHLARVFLLYHPMTKVEGQKKGVGGTQEVEFIASISFSISINSFLRIVSS